MVVSVGGIRVICYCGVVFVYFSLLTSSFTSLLILLIFVLNKLLCKIYLQVGLPHFAVSSHFSATASLPISPTLLKLLYC